MRKLVQDFRFHQGSDKIYLILIQKVCERTSLNGCLTSTIKKGYIIVLYRSPSQTYFEFNNSQHNLDKILNDVKPLGSTFFTILGDFNAKSKTWWTHDITTNEGVRIESLTSTYVWFASANIRPNPYLAKLILIYRSDLH